MTRRRTCRSAVDATIKAMRDAGRLEEVDQAQVTTAQALADAVDAAPGVASLWREFQSALVALRHIGEGAPDDSLASLLDKLRAPVHDGTETREENPRT